MGLGIGSGEIGAKRCSNLLNVETKAPLPSSAPHSPWSASPGPLRGSVRGLPGQCGAKPVAWGRLPWDGRGG